MNTAAEAAVYGVANMTTNKGVKFHIYLSDAVPEATLWSIADADRIPNWMQRHNSGINRNEEMQFKMALFIHLIKLEA